MKEEAIIIQLEKIHEQIQKMNRILEHINANTRGMKTT